MKNIITYFLIFCCFSLFGQNNDFETPPFTFQSDYMENTNSSCEHNEYSITANWNFGTCIKLPSNRTGDGNFMMFENDPSEAATGKLFYRDIIATNEGYYKMSIDVNHRNFSWGNYPLREIPLRLYVDDNYVDAFIVPLSDSWVTLDLNVFFTNGSHTFDLRQDHAPAGTDDDFAIDNIEFTSIVVDPSFCDVRVASNPDQILNNTACVFDFLQIYADQDNVWISVLLNGNNVGDHLTVGPEGWVDLNDIYNSTIKFCTGDELEIITYYEDENGIWQECSKTLTLVCCEANTSVEYQIIVDSQGDHRLSCWSFNGLPDYIETPQYPVYNPTCNGLSSTWCVFEATSPDGNFLPFHTTNGSIVNLTIDPDNYYQVISTSTTQCSEDCSLITVHPNPFDNSSPLVDVNEDFCCPDANCLVDELCIEGERCEPVFDIETGYSELTDIFGNTIIVTCYYLNVVELNLPTSNGYVSYDYDVYVNGSLRQDNLICCGTDCTLANLLLDNITIEIDGCDPYVLTNGEKGALFTTPNGNRPTDSQENSLQADILNNVFHVASSRDQIASLTIYSANGERVRSINNIQLFKGPNNISLDLSHLPQNGIYLISLIGEDFQVTKKHVFVR